MPDTALTNAMTERDRIAAEINRFQQQLEELRARHRVVDAWISAYHTFAGTRPDADETASAQLEQDKNIQAPVRSPAETVDKEPERTRATGNPKKEHVAQVARDIISEIGEPVSRSDLFKLLVSRGVIIEGKDPEQVLSTMLWRTREEYQIVRVSTGGYWLAERPHEASGYVPERDAKDDIAQILSTPAEEISNRTAEFEELGKLRASLEEADEAYHSADAPIMSDGEYDSLRRKVSELEESLGGVFT